MYNKLDDDSDAELLAYVKKLYVHAPPAPFANLNRGRDRDQRSSFDEIFPSPGTRVRTEKKCRERAAKSAPYVPPKGTHTTRAASMIEKEQTRSQQAAVTVARRR